MAKIDFSQQILDVFGDPIPEAYPDAAVEARAFLVCERCGTGTPHHTMKQRPITLGSVVVGSLMAGSAKGVSDEDVIRDAELARRIVGPTKRTWATLEFEDATELARIKKAVQDSPRDWAKAVRAAVIEALKV